MYSTFARSLPAAILVAASLIVTLAADDAASAPPNDAVSRWSGEGNANDSVDANNGTTMNGAAFATGIVGQAFSLDGTDDFVEVPDNASLDPDAGSFTASAWFFRTGAGTFTDQSMPIVGHADGDFDNGWQMVSGGSAGSPAYQNPVCFVDDATHTVSVTTGDPIPANRWAHLVCVYDASADTLKLFIDGGLNASGGFAVEGPVNATSALLIGKFKRLSLARDEFFPGLIDEVQYFGRALTDEEVREIFNAVIPLKQGDVDCSGSVNSVDALKVLRFSADLSVAQKEPCTNINDLPAVRWGDVDCSGGVNSVDALKVLRHSAALPVQQMEPCPDINTPLIP
jgi:hypothetical protein